MDNRIHGQQARTIQPSTHHLQSGEARGNFRGTPVTLSTTPDVDDVNQAKQLLVARGVKDAALQALSSRTIGSDVRLMQLSGAQLNRIADHFGGRVATAKLAAKYLDALANQGRKPEVNQSLASVMQHFAALKMLAAAARAGGQDVIARVTPMPEGNGGLNELAKALQDANDDPQKLKALLANVGGLPTDANELFQMMKTLRFNPRELGEALREKQGLPALDSDQLKLLAEAADDLLGDLESAHGSRIKAARNALESGQQLTEPGGFAESYVDLLHESQGFSSFLQNLLEKHAPEGIPKLLKLLEQTLGDEIRLDQNSRSLDITKLEAIHTELSMMHISNTLLEKLGRLATGLQRVFPGVAGGSIIDERQLLKAVLKTLSAGWVAPSHFERMAVDLKLPDGAPRIFFLTGILQVIRELPFKIFDDENMRLAVIEAAQSALDGAIAREEESLATEPPSPLPASPLEER